MKPGSRVDILGNEMSTSGGWDVGVNLKNCNERWDGEEMDSRNMSIRALSCPFLLQTFLLTLIFGKIFLNILF